MDFVGFDIETADADSLFTYGEGFVRIGGWSSPDGPRTTSDIKGELIPALNDARWIYAHNFFGFDGLAMAYHYPDLVNWEELAAKALDTMVLERLRFPPEARDTGGSVDKYDLDNCCARHGVGGKTDHLPALAKLHGGYDQIPVNDEAYLAYLRGDITALEALFNDLASSRNRYAKREMEVESWLGRMTLNGFRVDLPLLNERIEQTEERKQGAIQGLAADFGLPLGRFNWKGRAKDKIEEWEEFASPLSTLEGRQWLLRVWNAYGIVNPPLTETGRLSTKAETLRELIETGILNPELAYILEQVMIITTTRTVYQTVQDHLVGDRVHPRINMGQASGRSSVTRPGLTVFGKRGERYHERDIFIGEEGSSIFTCDLKQIDMRCIAALCQDRNYMALFEDGRDPHTETAIKFFGSADFRDRIKPITHGANYGLGRKKLIEQGHDPRLVKGYFDERRAQFVVLSNWQDEIREQAREGLLDNGWGRKMKCHPNRLYTQPPALMGQGAAADALKECLLRLPEHLRPHVRMTVHDEIDFSGPDEHIEEIMFEAKRAMTFGLANDNGRLIVVDHDEPGCVPIEADIEGPAKSWGGVIAASK